MTRAQQATANILADSLKKGSEADGRECFEIIKALVDTAVVDSQSRGIASRLVGGNGGAAAYVMPDIVDVDQFLNACRTAAGAFTVLGGGRLSLKQQYRPLCPAITAWAGEFRNDLANEPGRAVSVFGFAPTDDVAGVVAAYYAGYVFRNGQRGLDGIVDYAFADRSKQENPGVSDADALIIDLARLYLARTTARKFMADESIEQVANALILAGASFKK